MRRLTSLVVLVAFVFSCGGQWYVLQAIAWGNMIREYSTMVPVAQAVSMTLSGQYPCAICKRIAEHKNSEHDKIATIEKQEKKILISSNAISRPPAPPANLTFVTREVFLVGRSDSPPTPPPRFA